MTLFGHVLLHWGRSLLRFGWDFSADDVRVSLLIGDVFVISQWSEAMVEAGTQVQAMRALVKGSDLSSATADPRFQNMRSALQRSLAGMVKASKVRFSEPWGMICLYSAAGFPDTASGRLSMVRSHSISHLIWGLIPIKMRSFRVKTFLFFDCNRVWIRDQ